MLFLIGTVIVLIDQVIKQMVIGKFGLGEGFPVLNDIFHITYVKNTGAAFGLLEDHTQLFSILSIFIIVIFLYLRRNYLKKGLWVDIAIGLIIGGALGNLIDRVWLGFVVDYIDLRIWPVFNLADSAVVVGSLLLATYLWNNELKI
jgi:signal peptidase II